VRLVAEGDKAELLSSWQTCQLDPGVCILAELLSWQTPGLRPGRLDSWLIFCTASAGRTQGGLQTTSGESALFQDPGRPVPESKGVAGKRCASGASWLI
jgi:hypothetical protein